MELGPASHTYGSFTSGMGGAIELGPAGHTYGSFSLSGMGGAIELGPAGHAQHEASWHTLPPCSRPCARTPASSQLVEEGREGKRLLSDQMVASKMMQRGLEAQIGALRHDRRNQVRAAP